MNTAFFLVTLVLNYSVQPLTDPQAVQLLVDCFNHEFLLSHPAFTQTQSLPYMQPARCLGWKFSTEEASVVCMLIIYINCIFLFNSIFPPFFLLSGLVYFSPKVGGAKRKMLCQRTHNSPVADVADEVEGDSCINH